VENTPNTEQEIAEVVRRNADLKKQHDEMSAKLDSSKLSESLESRQKGQQFQIVDPANYPLSPTKPSKVKVILVGNAIVLLIAIAIAVGVDVARQKMWTQSEVQKLWGFPVLVEIPEILTDADIAAAKRRRLGFIATSVVGAAVYSLCLYQVYLRQATVLKLLDPLVQSLIY
jgi:polysaccharide biosynthesis transport protein